MKATAGMIENFTEGWAFIWPNKKVHHWKVDLKDDEVGITLLTSVCNVEAYTTPNKPALNGGTWPKCRHCERMLAKP